MYIVPVTETGQEEILNAARQAVCQGVDALEWRIDWFEQASHWSRVQEILLDLAKICEHKILLCTFRTRQQGGQRELTEEVYLELLEEIAKSGLADLLDVEVPQLSDVSTVIGQLQNAGQRVIGSSHYFSGTPETDQMKQELMEMYRAGADIAKLAVMPKSRLGGYRPGKGGDSRLSACNNGNGGTWSDFQSQWSIIWFLYDLCQYWKGFCTRATYC